MPFERDSLRIVIAGASSLLGAEVKSLLEASRFAASDFRLLDEELAAGLLTEAGGEPAVIRPVEEDSFDRARFVFFTGSIEFTRANLALAQRSGAVTIDLSGHSVSLADAVPWFRGIETLRGQELLGKPRLAAIPSAAAEALTRLSLGLQTVGLKCMAATVLQPISAVGRAGIEELETQTSQLLSLQTPGKQLFDAQVAFNTLQRFGAGSRFDPRAALATFRAEVNLCLRGSSVLPAVELVQVPVFYGTTFSIYAELDPAIEADGIQSAYQAGGLSMLQLPETPSNVGVAEESTVVFAQAWPDPAKRGAWWFWGAADNIRLPAWNAVKFAEKFAE
jgi:aspartate-semialdehyde dehydrogenase